VDLRLDACVDASAAEVERLVGIELAAMGPEHAEAVGQARVTVEVGCRRERVFVRVDDPITDKSLERPVRLGRAAPAARSRLLALAIVELLVASWTELAARPAAAAAPSDEPAPPPAPEPARKAAQAIARARLPRAPAGAEAPGRRLTLGAFAGGAHVLGALAPAAGLRLVVHRPRFSLSLDGRAERASAPMPSGRAVLEAASVSPIVFARVDVGAFMFSAGAGARAGVGRLAGEPASPRYVAASFSAPYAGALTSLRAGRRLGGRLVLEVEAEAGLVIVPIEGLVEGVRETALEGAWVGATVALGVVL
jgi:hypothetical protein